MIYQRQSGFSLLEALIASIIVAVGMLGLAALQLRGFQDVHSAQQSTVAAMMVQDAVDRLWIRRNAAPFDEDENSIEEVAEEWLDHWRRGAETTTSPQPLSLRFDTNNLPTIVPDSDNAHRVTITVNWLGHFCPDAEESEDEPDEDEDGICQNDTCRISCTIDLPE